MLFFKFENESTSFLKLIARHPCLMFLFIQISHLIISLFYKKSKLIGFQLRLNRQKKKLKKQKKLYSSSIITCERMNSSCEKNSLLLILQLIVIDVTWLSLVVFKQGYCLLACGVYKLVSLKDNDKYSRVYNASDSNKKGLSRVYKLVSLKVKPNIFLKTWVYSFNLSFKL